jgi:ABC-type transporter MlaC component
MKKLLFLIALFTTTILSAQTSGYWAMEFKAKINAENNISEAFDKVFKDIKQRSNCSRRIIYRVSRNDA